MVRVAAFTGGKSLSSARFRVRQYIKHLAQHGVELTELTTPLGMYPPALKAMRPFWALGSVATRIPGLIKSYSYDVTLLQRELLSTSVTLEPLTKRPRVLDVDDAIWLNRRGGFARRLAAMCDLVICGNEYVADYFSRWNNNITLLPTTVDTGKFAPKPKESARERSQKIIGWSGLSVGHSYLYRIEASLAQVLEQRPEVKLRIVSDRAPSFGLIPPGRWEYRKWSPENEAETLQDLTVGIMPLADTEWEKGKCSYKMLLYMACGVPVVVSPYGMNAKVLSLGDVGIGASNHDEWVAALLHLIENEETGRLMGERGRSVILHHFSLEAHAPVLASYLSGLAHQPLALVSGREGEANGCRQKATSSEQAS
jgi:glycosyltransferase involved in cell wall biosynthesis